ncbi:MAG: hypothetical protein ACK4F6_17800 [Hylemonella sp.]
MPTLLEDPRSVVLNVSITEETASLISRLSALLEVDSLEFSALLVLKNVQRCLHHTISQLPSAREPMAEICHVLDAAIGELTSQQLPNPGRAAGFMPPNRLALRVLSRLPERAPDPLLRTVGNLLISSLLTDLPLPKQRFESLSTLCRAVLDEPSLSEEQTRTLGALLSRSSADLAEVLNQHVRTQDKSVLRFNSQLINHLRSEVSSAHPVVQRDADVRKFLSGTALFDTVSKLKNETTAGDADALGMLLGFSLNFQWDLLCQVPLRSDDQGEGHILWLDGTRGVAHLDIRPLLRDLGQPIPGCEVTSDMLRLPLPKFVAEQLKLAWTMRPSAQRVGDLVDQQSFPTGTVDDARSASVRSKFLRSGPSSAIRLTGNRAVAAYAFLAFHLLDHSDLPYINISEDQIWSLRAQVFDAAGLGDSVIVDDPAARRVGSARTAQEQTARAIFADLDLAVAKIKVGRSYSLPNLIEHHNRYAKRVGMFLHFVSGARASATTEFLASAWPDSSPFGFLDDKSVGIAQSRTPIPLSPAARAQLKLWQRHITSLQDRLSKKLGHKANAAHSLIDAIRKNLAVPLLFLLDGEGKPQQLKTEHLFTGKGVELNRDWGRHLLATKLIAEERPLADVHLFLRHQGRGINPQSASGIEILGDRLLGTSLAIDSILLALDIRPLPGLAGASA